MSDSAKEVFSDIYRNQLWGCGSGYGSGKEATAGYCRFLADFLRDRSIRSVVDLGCGDWHFSRLIDWDGIDYHGFDLVDEVVKTNLSKYKKANIHFSVLDDLRALPPADLLIVKDVLQHWDNASIQAFLPDLKKYRYVLITNALRVWNATGDVTLNRDIRTGGFRTLDLSQSPFNWDVKKVFEFDVVFRDYQGWKRILRWIPYRWFLPLAFLLRKKDIERKAVFLWESSPSGTGRI